MSYGSKTKLIVYGIIGLLWWHTFPISAVRFVEYKSHKKINSVHVKLRNTK